MPFRTAAAALEPEPVVESDVQPGLRAVAAEPFLGSRPRGNRVLLNQAVPEHESGAVALERMKLAQCFAPG